MQNMKNMSQNNRRGFVTINDLKKLERIKRDVFEDLGPFKKDQVYYIGEMGEESELRFMSSK
jgi:hypothetical protein